MYLNKVLSLSVINVSQPESGMAALAGLPAYLELAIVSGLNGSIQPHQGSALQRSKTGRYYYY
jgi:hypothetical protein